MSSQPIAESLIKPSFRKLFDNDLLNDHDIEELRDLNYCKKIFSIPFPILILMHEKHDKARYYRPSKADNIYGGKYLLCNHWYESQREAFEEWLSKFNI